MSAIFGSDEESTAPLQALLDKITREYLFGKVMHIVATPSGCFDVSAPATAILKLEAFLRVIEEQRDKHLQRNWHLARDAEFSSSDMKELHKAWMEDHKSWMDPETIDKYNWWRSGKRKGDQQKAHQMRKSAFSAYLFQFIGNKHLLLAFIQHGVCSAAQPAKVIERLMDAWEKEKATDEHKMRVETSQRLTEKHKELKRKAHAARQDLVRAKQINTGILHKTRLRKNLLPAELSLLEDFKSGKLQKILEECDAAFGWNKEKRDTFLSAAARIGGAA